MSQFTTNLAGTVYTVSTTALAAPHVEINGMRKVGLAKALAEKAIDAGQSFGLPIVGNPGDGVTIIKDAITSDQLYLYTP